MVSTPQQLETTTATTATTTATTTGATAGTGMGTTTLHSPQPTPSIDVTTYGSTPPSSSGESLSSPLDEDEDAVMSEDGSTPSVSSPLPDTTSTARPARPSSSPRPRASAPPAAAAAAAAPPPVPGPMFLNFKRDLSLKVAKPKEDKNKVKASATYKVNGVNILNKASVDGKTVIERQKLRRVRHNHIERLRRDNINNIIQELSTLIPGALAASDKPNKGNVLKLTLDHVKSLHAENQALRCHFDAVAAAAATTPSPPPQSRPESHHPHLPLPLQHQPQMRHHHHHPLHLEIPPQHPGIAHAPISPRSPSSSFTDPLLRGSSPPAVVPSPSSSSSPLFRPIPSPRASLSPMVPPLEPYLQHQQPQQQQQQQQQSLPSINLHPIADTEAYRSAAARSAAREANDDYNWVVMEPARLAGN